MRKGVLSERGNPPQAYHLERASSGIFDMPARRSGTGPRISARRRQARGCSRTSAGIRHLGETVTAVPERDWPGGTSG